MEQPSFASVSSLQRQQDDQFTATVADGWQQGRGAYGGLVLGTLLRAMDTHQGDPARRARALTGDLMGPVMPGPVHIRTTCLRRGNNQTNMQATLSQNDTLLACATATFSTARRTPGPTAKVIAPAVPARWQDVDIVPVGSPIGPPFARHFTYRNTGPMPMSGGSEARCSGFLAPKVATAVDAPLLIGMLDAWWPALLSISETLHAMSTISFAAQILCDPSTLSADTPLYYTGAVVTNYEGFAVEERGLWLNNRPVALNQQTFVVLS